MTILAIAEVAALAKAALERAWAATHQAAPTASALVAAESDGQAGHGLCRLAAYAAQVRSGKVNGYARPTSLRTKAALLRIDAGHGFAIPAFDEALEAMPPMVSECGLASAANSRSHHAGVLGRTVEKFALSGFVALMMANSPGAMAPWGGRRALFGTNPIAIAARVPASPPLVVDLSLSRIA